MPSSTGQKLVLSKAVRLFGEVERRSTRLYRSDMWIRAGETVFLGGLVNKVYGHRVLMVRQVLNLGAVYFVIASELFEDPWHLKPPTNPEAYIAVRAG